MKNCARIIWAAALLACVGCSDTNKPQDKGGPPEKGKSGEAKNTSPANLWTYSPRETIGEMNPHFEQIQSAAGGRMVATFATNMGPGEFALWDAADGAAKARWGVKIEFLEDRVAVSPDAKWVAGQFGGGVHPRGVVVWDAQTGAEKHRLAAPKDATDIGFGFTADGKRLLCGDPTWSVVLNLETGAHEPFAMPSGYFHFSAAGRMLFDTGRSGTQFILLYESVDDFVAGRAGRSIFPAGRKFEDIATALPTGGAMGGTAVEVVGDKKTPVAWSLAPSARKAHVIAMDRKPAEPRESEKMRTSPAGRYLAMGIQGLWVLDLSTGKSVEAKPEGEPIRFVEGIGFLPDGTLVAEHDKRPVAINPADGKPGRIAAAEQPLAEPADAPVAANTPVQATLILHALAEYCYLKGLAFSADGKTLVTAGDHSYNVKPEERKSTVTVIDMADGPRRKRTVAIPGEPDISQVSVNADGTAGAVLTSGRDAAVLLIDLAAGKSGKTLGPIKEDSRPRELAISLDAKTVWVSDGSTSGEFDAAAPEKPKQTLESAKAPSAFLAGGKVLLGSDTRPTSSFGQVKVWSADGTLFAVGENKKVTVTDAAGAVRRTITTTADVKAVALSNTRVCVRDDKTVQVYDLATGNPIMTLLPADPDASAFSPDGKTLALAGGNKISFWTFP